MESHATGLSAKTATRGDAAANGRSTWLACMSPPELTRLGGTLGAGAHRPGEERAGDGGGASSSTGSRHTRPLNHRGPSSQLHRWWRRRCTRRSGSRYGLRLTDHLRLPPPRGRDSRAGAAAEVVLGPPWVTTRMYTGAAGWRRWTPLVCKSRRPPIRKSAHTHPVS
jgi:hypothetical protein